MDSLLEAKRKEKKEGKKHGRDYREGQIKRNFNTRKKKKKD